MAIETLQQYAGNCHERDQARDVFCGDFEAGVRTMTGHFREVSDAAFLFWFAFDYRLDDGSHLVNRVLNDQTIMSSGERRYLE